MFSTPIRKSDFFPFGQPIVGWSEPGQSENLSPISFSIQKLKGYWHCFLNNIRAEPKIEPSKLFYCVKTMLGLQTNRKNSFFCPSARIQNFCLRHNKNTE